MKKSIILALLAICSLSAVAQTGALRSGYFLNRMNTRHKINPAQVNDYGYFAIPALGSIGISANSSIGMANFLYPTESGELNTFMHPDISADEFLGGLDEINTIQEGLDIALLSTGFFAWGGYNTFDLSLKQSVTFDMPKGIFALMKGGASEYDLTGLGFNAQSHAELALGHAHKINDKLTAGAKVKMLLGLGSAQVTMDDMLLTMNETEWKLRAAASGRVALLGSPISVGEDGTIGMDMDNFAPALGGAGAAIDLGVTYEVIDNLTLSAAVTDLGMLSWNNASEIAIEGGEVTLLDENTEIDINDPDALGATLEGVTDGLTDMMAFNSTQGAAYSTTLAPTLTVGAEYSLLNDKISAGLLSTTRFRSIKTITELMAVVNLRPAKWAEFALSGSVSNIGNYWGFVINLAPSKVLNLFVGADCMVSKVSPQYIPVGKPNMSLNLGLSIPIGGNLGMMSHNAKSKQQETL